MPSCLADSPAPEVGATSKGAMPKTRCTSAVAVCVATPAPPMSTPTPAPISVCLLARDVTREDVCAPLHLRASPALMCRGTDRVVHASGLPVSRCTQMPPGGRTLDTSTRPGSGSSHAPAADKGPTPGSKKALFMVECIPLTRNEPLRVSNSKPWT